MKEDVDLTRTRKKMTVKEDVAKKERWVQQDTLISGGLIGIGVVILQPFISAETLDLPSKICVVAFSLAIPLLAFLVMIDQVQLLYHSAFYPNYRGAAKGIGQMSACVGVIAAIWHVLWYAGVVMLISGILGFIVYSIYIGRLAREKKDQFI